MRGRIGSSGSSGAAKKYRFLETWALLDWEENWEFSLFETKPDWNPEEPDSNPEEPNWNPEEPDWKPEEPDWSPEDWKRESNGDPTLNDDEKAGAEFADPATLNVETTGAGVELTTEAKLGAGVELTNDGKLGDS